MKRLFFPYTAMAPELAAALNAALGPTTLLHPLPEAVADRTSGLAEARQIELIFPAREDGEDLMTAMASFRRWAAERAGTDLSGLVIRGEAVPFFGADASSRIAAEIRKGAAVTAGTAHAERLQRARLLLLLAEEFDTRHRELASDLRACENQERRMLEALKGEGDPLAGSTGQAAATAAVPVMHMLAARLAAWAQLALALADQWAADRPALFLTDCREVLDHVCDQTAAEMLLDGHPVSPAAGELSAWLAAPQSPPPVAETPSAVPSIRLSLVRLTDRGMFAWLRGMAGAGVDAAPDPDRDASADSVLVGMVARG